MGAPTLDLRFVSPQWLDTRPLVALFADRRACVAEAGGGGVQGGHHSFQSFEKYMLVWYTGTLFDVAPGLQSKCRGKRFGTAACDDYATGLGGGVSIDARTGKMVISVDGFKNKQTRNDSTPWGVGSTDS